MMPIVDRVGSSGESRLSESNDLRELILASSDYANRNEWGNDALAVNRRLARLAPEAHGVWWRLAVCARSCGEHSEARAALQMVIKLQPGTGSARSAERQLVELDAEVAASACREPEDALDTAISEREHGNPYGAIVWHRRAAALARTPREKVNALTAWASTLRGLRDFAPAHQLIRDALAQDPDRRTNKAAYTALVAVLTDMERLAEAEKHAVELLRLHPSDRYVLNTAGRTFRALHKKAGNGRYGELAASCFARAERSS